MDVLNNENGKRVANAIRRLVNNEIEGAINKAPYTTIRTGVITQVSDMGYTITIDKVTYPNVPALKNAGSLKKGDRVECVIPNNQFSNMFIIGSQNNIVNENLFIGQVVTFAVATDNPSFQRLDGRNLLQNGMYEEFCKWLKTKASKDPTSVAIYTIEEYANIMATYGQCGGFVINNTGSTLTSGTYSVDANSIKLPTITEFIASNNSGENIGVSELDEFKSHQHKLMRYNSQYQAGYGVGTHTGTIAETATTVYISEILTNNVGGLETKPKNIRYPYYIVVSNGIQDNIQINLNNIINDINNINNKIKNVENVETIYDSSSSDPNINWGYTNGIVSSTGTVSKNLTKYKKLIGTVQWRNPTDVINQYSGYGQVVCDLTKSFGENYYCGQNTFVTFNEINYLWSVNCKLYVTINKDGVGYAGYYANSANETNTTAGILIKLEGVY